MAQSVSQHTFEIATQSVETTEVHLHRLKTLLEQQTTHQLQETTVALTNLVNVCPSLRAQLVSAAVINDLTTAETALSLFGAELQQLLAQVETLCAQTQQCLEFIDDGKRTLDDVMIGFQVLHKTQTDG